ncbi:MAG: hypothetical protein VR70_16945 [Rhodospirillaceae bacterium BRH_c57]|nr:MAG: hypothetical protein VR70_16945 [Rhodospirillaceae bacterium BRH_c57]
MNAPGPRRRSLGLVLAGVCVLQIALLLAVVGRQLHTVATGQAVVLDSAPVAPLPLYRGGDVPLRYGFSDIPVSLLPTSRPPRPGDRLWVVLSSAGPDGSVVPWRLERVLVAPPGDGLGPRRLLLRGYVRAAPDHGGTIVCPLRGGECRVWVDYGLERFPVPDAEATRWEDWRRGERLSVVARVTGRGNAVVTGLLLGEHLVRRDILDWLGGAEGPTEVPRPKGPAPQGVLRNPGGT